MAYFKSLTHQNCLICNLTITDGDFVCVFKEDGSGLTDSGKLYEELIEVKMQIYTETENYPICNSCDLQIKLFKRLKEKAWKTLSTLGMLQISVEEETSVTDQNQNSDTFASSQEQLSEEVPIHNCESLLKHKINTNEQTETQTQSHTLGDAEIKTNTKKNNKLALLLGNDELDFMEHTSQDEDIENMLIVYDMENDDEVIKAQENSNLSSKQNAYEVSIDGDGGNIEGTRSRDTEENNADEPSCDVATEVQFLDYEANANEQQISAINESLLGKRDDSIAFSCKDCNMEFTTARLFKSHRQSKHPPIYRCETCCKTVKSAESLEVHRRQHLGLPPYACDKCNKTFNQKVHYQYHMKRHNNERNFCCNICNKSYVSKSDLNMHMRLHSDERPYVCYYENCGKQFYNEQHLKVHLYHHRGEKNFKCEICQRKFVSPTALSLHRKTIHATEKNFACTKCNKKFRRKHHLECHLAVHTKNNFNFEKSEDTNTADSKEQTVVIGGQYVYEDISSVQDYVVQEAETEAEAEAEIETESTNVDSEHNFLAVPIDNCSEDEIENESKAFSDNYNYFEFYAS